MKMYPVEVGLAVPTRRIDIKGILSDPLLRRELCVRVIVATQLREGIVTTLEQAERAYDMVQRSRTYSGPY